MSGPTAADEHEHMLGEFRRRVKAIVSQHTEPAKPEHVQEIVTVYNTDPVRRLVIADELSRYPLTPAVHPWLIRNREMVNAWLAITPYLSLV